MSLCVKRLSNTAILPTRGSAKAVGYDLCADEDCTILPGRRHVVRTGLSLSLPDGCYARIAPRSGLAIKFGIQVGAGVVDPDYTGEVKVVLFNHDRRKYVIKPGYRIAQLVLEQCLTPDVIEVDSIASTARGDGGFGSTGMTTSDSWADIASDEEKNN